MSKDRLERLQAWASIVSAIAIPIVLAVVGHFVQRQLSEEGLKKDYVGIAAGILKDAPAQANEDLRRWAVAVLDANSPIPLTAKAKDDLFNGLAFIPTPYILPPEACLQPVGKRTVHEAFEQLPRTLKANDSPEKEIKDLYTFIELVIKQERLADDARSKLECLQNFARAMDSVNKKLIEETGGKGISAVEKFLAKPQAASSPR